MNNTKPNLMKKTLLLVLLMTSAYLSKSQFVTKPLNFPDYGFVIPAIRILDANNVWLGPIRYLPDNSLGAYSKAVHTSDGGDTWIYDSIPAPGTPVISGIFPFNASTAYYVFTDGGANGSIWKTTDAGNNWTCKTTNEFDGGFADWYYGFSADTGIALGDPTQGYMDIQLTYNGGDTWTRVPSANIPAILPGEMGIGGSVTARGNTIWFPTGQGRVYKSIDRGLNWTVANAGLTGTTFCGLDFASDQNGVFCHRFIDNYIFRTLDGGTSWDTVTLAPNLIVADINHIEGFEEGYVIEVGDAANNYLVNILFTPDNFESVLTIDTQLSTPGYMKFKDASTGWLSGPGTPTDDIFKFTGLLTGVQPIPKQHNKLMIMPNPTRVDALVVLPDVSANTASTLQIFDINGKLIEEIPQAAGNRQTIVHSSAYITGTYILRVIAGNEVVGEQRWIVQH
jgi:photosystem II stability/assembly factor-like uncharacterized protein